MDVRRLLTIARKWLPLLVGGLVIAAIVGFVISSLQPKAYEAKTTLIVGQSLSTSSPDYSALLASQQLATTYASIAATRSQLESAISQLGLTDTPDDLARRVDAAVVPGSSLVTIAVQDTDPKQAAQIANALAAGLIREIAPSAGQEQDFKTSLDKAMAATQAQIDSTQASVQTLLALPTLTAAQQVQLATLQSQLVTLRSSYATMLGLSSTTGATNTLAVVDPAVAPTDPIGPRTLLNTLVAAILGLLAALAIVALAEYRNDTVGDGDQIERISHATLLATVGALKVPDGWGAYPLATVMAPRSGAAEAYRTLRANLEFASVDKELSTLLVTSAQPGEGKTLTAANIAVAWSQTGRRVLLVDADLRLPMIHTAFALRNEVGLTTALVVEAITLDRLVMESGQPNLWVVPSGPLPPNPAELLSSHRMRTLLEAAKASYDLVVLDSSPLAATADAAVLGALVNATLLVVDGERGKRRALGKARDQLARAGASVVGVVFNRAPGGRGLEDTAGYGGYLRPAASSGATAPDFGGVVIAPSGSPGVAPAKGPSAPTRRVP